MSSFQKQRKQSTFGRLRPMYKRSRAGFTLIELLVVVTIIGLLAGLSVAGAFKALNAASSLKEANAAKSLITGYLAAASDNNGYFLPGYDRTVTSAQTQDGTTVTGPVAQRYPYRLAPYFNYDIKGTILTSNNASSFASNDYYQISTYPSFGINYLYVGGDVSAAGAVTNEPDVLKIAGRGSALLVFATAGDPSLSGNGNIEGYCKLEPPKGNSPWSNTPWAKGASPRNYGQIDARHGGKAICAFSDGSIRKLSVEELRDMRLWSYRAADEGNPDYTVSSN